MRKVLTAILFAFALHGLALAATSETQHKKAKAYTRKPAAAPAAGQKAKTKILQQGPLEPSPAKAETADPDTIALKPVTTKSGYIARMLLNEPAFPGEHGWVSEENSKAGMLAIIWVCHARIHYVPPGYTQRQVAATKTQDIIDIMTAGGEKGQVDGFYRDKTGAFRVLPRVLRRTDELVEVANKGPSGRFAHLVQYAQGLADAYVAGGIQGADRFAGLRIVNSIKVTGRAYSWMTDRDYYHPGGNFVKIPDENEGSLGDNRFFTLKELKHEKTNSDRPRTAAVRPAGNRASRPAKTAKRNH